jgi:uroporphyrinogen decarboxylase
MTHSLPPLPAKAVILIVDDVPANLHVLSQMLTQAGYKTRAVTDGELALETAQKSQPDIILLDVNMPGMDGYETCRRLKAEPPTRSIPVIFLSALGDVEDKVRAFEVGGVDYMTKPFQAEEVVARVETHLAIHRLQMQLEETNQELSLRLEELTRLQTAEREQRVLAETLRDTIAAINSTLDYDEVLDLILENLARVMPHDTANIALLDENGYVQIKRARGYQARGLQDYMLSFRQPYEHFIFWRKVVGSRLPLIVPDVLEDEDWVAAEEMFWERSYACAPIVNQGKVIGLLNLESATPNFFSPVQIGRLQTFADQAAVAIEKARLFEETQRLAITDGLTGIYNRRHLLSLAEKQYQRSLRYHEPFSMLMIDLDHFKLVNDRYGHPVGDQVLCRVVQACQSTIRKVDFLGRYGGEEFLILMPQTGYSRAKEAADRVHRAIQQLVIEVDSAPVRVTISLGVATFDPLLDSDLDALIKRVDDALYAAKAGGRNRVSVAPLRTDSPNISVRKEMSMNKRDLVFSLLDQSKPPAGIPAGFFLHFPSDCHSGPSAIEKHLEYFRFTGMDFVKIQYEHKYPYRPDIQRPADWARVAPFPKDFFDEPLQVVAGLVQAAKAEAPVIITLYSPFMCAGHLAGIENLTAHLKEDPEAVRPGLEAVTESVLTFARECIRLGVDGFYASTQGGETFRFADPAIFTNYVKPCDLQVMEEINRACPFNILHVCDYNGGYSDLTPFKDYPGQVVNCSLELGDRRISTREAAEFFGRPFMGGVERKGLIVDGSPSEIRAAVEGLLRIAPERYILGADCTLPSTIPWENIRMAIELAHAWHTDS